MSLPPRPPFPPPPPPLPPRPPLPLPPTHLQSRPLLQPPATSIAPRSSHVPTRAISSIISSSTGAFDARASDFSLVSAFHETLRLQEEDCPALTVTAQRKRAYSTIESKSRNVTAPDRTQQLYAQRLRAHLAAQLPSTKTPTASEAHADPTARQQGTEPRSTRQEVSEQESRCQTAGTSLVEGHAQDDEDLDLICLSYITADRQTQSEDCPTPRSYFETYSSDAVFSACIEKDQQTQGDGTSFSLCNGHAVAEGISQKRPLSPENQDQRPRKQHACETVDVETLVATSTPSIFSATQPPHRWHTAQLLALALCYSNEYGEHEYIRTSSRARLDRPMLLHAAELLSLMTDSPITSGVFDFAMHHIQDGGRHNISTMLCNTSQTTAIHDVGSTQDWGAAKRLQAQQFVQLYGVRMIAFPVFDGLDHWTAATANINGEIQIFNSLGGYRNDGLTTRVSNTIRGRLMADKSTTWRNIKRWATCFTLSCISTPNTFVNPAARLLYEYPRSGLLSSILDCIEQQHNIRQRPTWCDAFKFLVEQLKSQQQEQYNDLPIDVSTCPTLFTYPPDAAYDYSFTSTPDAAQLRCIHNNRLFDRPPRSRPNLACAVIRSGGGRMYYEVMKAAMRFEPDCLSLDISESRLSQRLIGGTTDNLGRTLRSVAPPILDKETRPVARIRFTQWQMQQKGFSTLKLNPFFDRQHLAVLPPPKHRSLIMFLTRSSSQRFPFFATNGAERVWAAYKKENPTLNDRDIQFTPPSYSAKDDLLQHQQADGLFTHCHFAEKGTDEPWPHLRHHPAIVKLKTLLSFGTVSLTLFTINLESVTTDIQSFLNSRMLLAYPPRWMLRSTQDGQAFYT
ncbi:hypothetical protein CC86DRAFT_410376 [Ophiobolus disseminans]|uniref:Uncharacterized protein n=1 Tax=Ophiobolus disseminans TaxID=1469910 RepID=A0A6A6ZLJ3_9PLEO|nr:hypothetical protein CC86DRAFT_410376 [Ophiobolus disseminans]